MTDEPSIALPVPSFVASIATASNASLAMSSCSCSCLPPTADATRTFALRARLVGTAGRTFLAIALTGTRPTTVGALAVGALAASR